MADVYDDFVTYLKSRSEVTDLVGSGSAARIFPEVPKQAAALPLLVIREVGGGQSHETLGGGPAGLAESVFQVWAMAATKTAAGNLAEAVRLAGPLQGYRGLMGSRFCRVSAAQHRDAGVDSPTAKTDQQRYWTRRIYRVYHDEPTS